MYFGSITRVVCALGLALFAACASPTPDRTGLDPNAVWDPFEPLNRRTYAFNAGLDRYVIGPVARGYKTVTPKTARNRARDFIDNVRTPVWLANELLQGDWSGSGRQAARFTLNTTFGLAGFYDFAAENTGLDKEREDFGQTLAVWGAPAGPYVIVPVLGPATPRDLVGRTGDFFIDPLAWAGGDDVERLRVAQGVVDQIDRRARSEIAIADIQRAADPYSQTRSLYLQNRRGLTREDDLLLDLPDFE